MSAKGDRSAGPSRGFWPRRGPAYQDARSARSRSWLPTGFALFAAAGVVVLVLGSTRIGQVVGAASEHFLLFYSGVFVLLALTATVGIGLISTDRIIMSPASRVTAQAVHRAVSFGAMAFLVIHIAFELAAGRSHAADVVLPFLDHGRTFYLGLGTVASDLMVMIAVTGIVRARLAHNMSPVAWRVLHSSAYAAWLMAIVHGLLAGRPAKAFFGFSGFVPWSYGGCVAVVGIALVVRFVATDRTGQTEGQPVPERPAPPWMPAAGVPALGQAGYGASHLSVTAARPYQRALPAGSASPAAASATAASLPVGRGQVDDHADFGLDDTRGQFGRYDTRVQFGRDDTRGQYGRDDVSGQYGRDDTRGQFGREDVSGQYGREDTRVQYGRDDMRGRVRRDETRWQSGPDETRRQSGAGETRGQFDRDDMSGQYGREDTRGRGGRDDTRRQFGRDDTRRQFDPDETRGRFDRDDAPAFEEDFSDYDVTGPLPPVPYSRYETRS